MGRKADEYRLNAEECQREANATSNDQDRSRWLKIAEAWLRMLTFQKSTKTEQFDSALAEKGTKQTDSTSSH